MLMGLRGNGFESTRLNHQGVGTIRAGSPERGTTMDQMETQSEAIERLRRKGFGAEYTVTHTGRIDCGDVSWDPAEITVDTIIRFEGMSNPSDEAMLLAVHAPDGIQGTILLPYGPDMTAEQVDATQALLISHRDRNLRLNVPDSPRSASASTNPRMTEVIGDEGMPGEFVDTPGNEPGDHSPPSA